MKKEVQIGLLALITTFIIVWGYNFIVGKNLFAKEKTLQVSFNNVQDLAVSSQVMVSGLPVGVVTAIELNPEDVKEIFVTLTVASKIRVPKTAKAILRNQGLMGDRYIELQFDKMCIDPNCAQDGDQLESVELGLISSIMDPSELDPFIEKIGPSVDTIMNKIVEDSLNAPLGRIIHNMDGTMRNLNNITLHMNYVLSKSSSDMNNIADNLSALSSALTNSQDKITNILSNFEKMSDDLANSSMVENTNQTIEQANSTLKGLENTMLEANQSIGELSSILKKIDENDGTMGALINDKGLYDNLESTSKNLSLLLQDFRLNPKRYVNVSVFGKKQKAYVNPESDPAEVPNNK